MGSFALAQTTTAYRPQPIAPSYDAVVLGSGLGGATAALRLAQKGLKVLLVEQGGAIADQADLDRSDPSKYILDIVKDRAAPLTFVGGQTKFYGAAFYRLRESDFQAVEHEAGVSPAWPVSYADLSPYYDEAERLYRVHGALNEDPTDPPRDMDYPFPKVPYAPLVETFAKRLTDQGAILSPVPRAVDYRPGGGCNNCPACDAHYCVRDGKMDAEIAAVRPALATGNVQVSIATRCARLILDGSGERVVACVLVRDGIETTVTAETIIAATGLRGTIELFLRSRTSQHPSGLGNGSGQLGRNLAGHSTSMFFPMMSLNKLPPVQTKSFALNALYHGAPDWPFPLGVVQLAGQMPFWRDASRLIRPAAKIVGEHCFTLFHMTEAPPAFDAGFTLEGDKIVAQVDPPHSLKSISYMRRYLLGLLGKAGYPTLSRKRAPYLWHEVGTARMGHDPKTSVVDPVGRVHGLKGLYVADAGVLPTAGAVNTGLTLAALALRTADHIAAKAA